MNGKKLACIVLMIFVGILAYSGQMLHHKAVAKREEATSAESAAFTAQTEITVLQTKVQMLRANSEDLRRFLIAWTPHIDKVQLQSDVENAILSSIRNNGLVMVSNRFEMREDRADTVIPKVVRANIVIEDDYSKTLNWFGELERRVPLARIMSCKLSGGEVGRQIRAEMQIEVPLPTVAAAPKV